MPTYRYRCTSCGEEFSTWMPMSEHAAEQRCICGATGRQVFDPVRTTFKENDSSPFKGRKPKVPVRKPGAG